jgi:hypothetical protein
VLLGSRAFEIFAEIVRACGATVSKDRLIGSVWSGAIVDDNTIQGFMQADLCAAQSLLGTLSVTSRGGATDV